MEAEGNGTAHGAWIDYTRCDWGDLIRGTKRQLQALGLGVGLAFPGEPGAPKRELKTIDRRGFPVKIETDLYQRDGTFTASLYFPGWPERPWCIGPWEHHAPGVKKSVELWRDVYTGGADALAAAGLVRLDQLPGAPGMRKVSVTILADGSVNTGGPGSNYRQARAPGAKSITRRSASTFRVGIWVTDEERKRRFKAEKAAVDEWEKDVRSRPRPAKLQPIEAHTMRPPLRVVAANMSPVQATTAQRGAPCLRLVSASRPTLAP